MGRGGARRATRSRGAGCSAAIRDLWGDVLEEIVAPQDGVVLFITSSPAVVADGLLLGLGADLAPA